ncbi:MAG TPA: tRNA 2-thiouridine(34) synthase MnmA [Phycisphaerales bacterium]|nr:tRNA 2-thiouridine(34) synthase MnmA [Phycisphaerales bacterium]
MPSSKGKVLVAMSGGVDSSVAAALLLREGYEVVGVFMRLGSPGETFDELQPYDTASVSCDPTKLKIGHQGCCSINDAADARLVAAELGVPFYVCNFKKDFGRIIDYFVDEYAAGRTPNPCVRCNDWLKFGKLHEYAKQIGADFVASGHYARVESSHSQTSSPKPQVSLRLLRGLDHSKDQSYVLFGVPRDQLARMLLPIGGFEKTRVRELAREFGLPVFDKPDSQEICFVPDNDYAGLVERRMGDAAASLRGGRIIDEEGNDVGTHDGQHRFTIGQRRGLSLSLGHPVYVVGKDAATNTVTVGPRERLACTNCTAGEANWLAEGIGASSHQGIEWKQVLAKYRYNSPPAEAQVRLLDAAPTDLPTPSGRRGRFEVRFAEPQYAVAPGQAIVLYDAHEPDVVLGGGWIEKAEPAGM